jgi:hypothetical protein
MAADDERAVRDPYQFALRGDLEQAGDEGGLAFDVESADV